MNTPGTANHVKRKRKSNNIRKNLKGRSKGMKRKRREIKNKTNPK